VICVFFENEFHMIKKNNIPTGMAGVPRRSLTGVTDQEQELRDDVEAALHADHVGKAIENAKQTYLAANKARGIKLDDFMHRLVDNQVKDALERLKTRYKDDISYLDTIKSGEQIAPLTPKQVDDRIVELRLLVAIINVMLNPEMI